jgi:hypothetical protein
MLVGAGFFLVKGNSQGNTNTTSSPTNLQGISQANTNTTPTIGVSTPTIGTTSTQTSPSPTTNAMPTPNTILYQANQSWSGWNGPSWHASNGFLTNDGTNNSNSIDPTIIAPYSLHGVSDYAVEIKMQLITPLDPTVFYAGNFPCFNILVRGVSTSQGWGGYQAGFYCFYPPKNAWLKTNQDYTTQTPPTHAPFDPGKTEHTHRVEVKGDSIRFLIDGGLICQTTDLQFSSGGQVGLDSNMLQLQISSFTIIAL